MAKRRREVWVVEKRIGRGAAKANYRWEPERATVRKKRSVPLLGAIQGMFPHRKFRLVRYIPAGEAGKK